MFQGHREWGRKEVEAANIRRQRASEYTRKWEEERQKPRTERIMSTALWCDKGNHAFSSKDEDKQHFVQSHTVRVPTGNSYGERTYQDRKEIVEEVDICGPCWKNNNPFQDGAGTPKQIPEKKVEE